jgi:hypothetical protein
MSPRSRAAILVIAGSLVVFAVGASLPIWSATRLHKDGPISAITVQGGPLWKADFVKDKGWVREQNWIRAGLLASVVTGGGLIVYRRLVPKPRPDPVGDYEEKADSSIPDGRVPAD